MKLIPESYQTPNAYVDLFMPYLESDEWRVLSYAIRHIFGWDDKIDSRRRRMSVSTFEHGVPGYPGCGLSRPAIVKVLGNLTTYGLMKKVGKPTSEGQLYELPAHSKEVDLDGLVARLEIKKTKSVARTKQARKVKKEQKQAVVQPETVSETNQQAVNVINHPSVSQTNQKRLVPLTSSGKSDLPTQNQLLKPTSQNQAAAKALLIFDMYRDMFGTVPPIIEDELRAYGEKYTDLIEAAFKEAAENNGKSWKYIRAILDRWGKSGSQPPPKVAPKGSPTPKRVLTPEETEAAVAALDAWDLPGDKKAVNA